MSIALGEWERSGYRLEAEALMEAGELFPWVALEAALPMFEVSYLEDGAVGLFELAPRERQRDGCAWAGAG